MRSIEYALETAKRWTDLAENDLRNCDPMSALRRAAFASGAIHLAIGACPEGTPIDAFNKLYAAQDLAYQVQQRAMNALYQQVG